MRQYFVQSELGINQIVDFDEQQAHHMKDVLRMRSHDLIRVVDQLGNCYLAELILEGNQVHAKTKELLANTNHEQAIIYCAALVKKDKWDYILQKAAELGASKIVPLITEKTIIHLDEKEVEKKLIRWNKITLEAAQQSNRTSLCEVVKPIKLKDIADYRSEVNLVPYEKHEDRMLLDLVDDRSITFVIGPEGGITPKEIAFLNNLGFVSVSLGKRILRAETAGLYTLSVIDAKRNSL